MRHACFTGIDEKHLTKPPLRTLIPVSKLFWRGWRSAALPRARAARRRRRTHGAALMAAEKEQREELSRRGAQGSGSAAGSGPTRDRAEGGSKPQGPALKGFSFNSVQL